MENIVFVSGSRAVKQLPAAAAAALDKITLLGFQVIVGDCYGVDVLVQRYLKGLGHKKVSVYHIGSKPRHSSGFNSVRVPGTRQTDKDHAMVQAADYGLAIWDGLSPGTKRNIEAVRKTRVIRL